MFKTFSQSSMNLCIMTNALYDRSNSLGRIAGKSVMEALKHNSCVKLLKRKQSFQSVLCPRHSVRSEKLKTHFIQQFKNRTFMIDNLLWRTRQFLARFVFGFDLITVNGSILSEAIQKRFNILILREPLLELKYTSPKEHLADSA